MKSFFSGMLGGAIIIAIIALICMFSGGLHNYNVQIINPNKVDSINKYADKIELIKKMQKDGILLTPQEYTSNVVSYYNTAITLLVFLFILFSFVSYFHLKFVSKEQISIVFEDKIQDSKKMEEIIMNAFVGKADDKYGTIENLEILRDKLERHESALVSLGYEEENIEDEHLI